MQDNAELIVFYDGLCPLCLAEMRKLKDFDVQHKLLLEDIQAHDFATRYPQFDAHALNARIHGLTINGKVLQGLDVTCLAWFLVGKHRWLRILRWPVIRWFADLAYWLFARYRYQFSYWLTGKKRCQVCDLNAKD